MQQERENYYQYWLANIKGVGNVTRRLLLQKFGTAEEVYLASPDVVGLLVKDRQLESIIYSKKNWNIFTEYEKLIQQKINFTYYGEEKYPRRLLDIPDPPGVLYYIGRLPAHQIPSAAIIGARMCSEYGRFAAQNFGSTLAAHGIQIISGLAMGVDGIGQEAALKKGGTSFGVMGCGVDICYPKSNRDIYEKLTASGGVLSEYCPQTEPKPQLFPPRNRIISGLADVVIVIEAKAKSGTLITVDMALEQGREVFAVPGRITDPLSAGCNRLIRQGAGIATAPQDILELLHAGGGKMENLDAVSRRSVLSEREKRILSVLENNPKSVECIMEEVNRACISEEKEWIPVHEVMQLLIELCLKGMAMQAAGGRFLAII